jgi:hypothetical protein
MFDILFWKSWPSVYQRTFWVFSGLVIIGIMLLWAANFTSPEPVIRQERSNGLIEIEFVTHAFRVGTIELPVPAWAYAILEHTVGGQFQPNIISSYIFFAILLAGMVGILTVISALRRPWFFAGMLLFILFVISLQLESAILYSPYKLPTAIVLILFVVVAYYFQFINSRVSYANRLFTFSGLTLVVSSLFALLPHTPNPLLFLSANALPAATIFSAVFIFMVAHEILASLIFVISRGVRQTKSLRHFLIISIVYITNLAILFVERRHIVEWNFLTINFFIFITISGVLGIWGFRNRREVYQGIIETDPFGVLFYLGMASICFGTLGYFLATANDPVIFFAQDAILYSHLGYGIIFLIFVISNFGSMLYKNQQVFKILYKPENMPYFTFRLAGLITTFIFFAYSNWRVSFHQVYAGYYNAKGDASFSENNFLEAEVQYKNSIFYATRNYHAHYAVANLEAANDEWQKERNEYQSLVDSRPIDLAYLNLSRAVERDKSKEEAMIILKNGLVDFPNNALLLNELGLAYASEDKRDSAFLLIDQARKSSGSSKTKTNLMGLIAKFKLRAPVDSLSNLWGLENPGVKSNGLALAAIQGSQLLIPVDPGNDTLLSVYSVTALYNFLINHAHTADTALISKTIFLARKNPNPFYREFLLSAAAYASYESGLTGQAFRLLREVAFLDQEEKYYHVLGLWSLEQQAAGPAAGYFDEALKKDYKHSYFPKAIALSEGNDVSKALVVWDSLITFYDLSVRPAAKKMQTVLLCTPATSISLSDEEKYLYSRCKIPLENSAEFDNLIGTIGDSELRARALVDRSKKYDEADDTDLAIDMLVGTQGLKLRDRSLYEEISQLNLLYLARKKNWVLLTSQLKSPVAFTGKYRLHKIYFDALLAAQAGRKEEAERNFTMLLSANPFFEDAIVAAVEYLSVEKTKKLAVYSELVHALDLNPQAIKLLKAYTTQSAGLDFEENAQQALDRLKVLMTARNFLQYVRENPRFFQVIPD